MSSKHPMLQYSWHSSDRAKTVEQKSPPSLFAGPESKELDCYKSTHHHHHQCVLPKSRSFSANSGTKAEILPTDRSSTANLGSKVAVLLGMNRCGSFLLLSAPHSLFSILKRRWPSHALCAKALFPVRVPGHVPDARAERSKHNNEGMNGGEGGLGRGGSFMMRHCRELFNVS